VTSFAFGMVTCSAGNNVAWLQCATAFACTGTVSAGGHYAAGIQVGSSYWGVQGWLLSVYSGGGPCFFAYPSSSSVGIHHIVFANDICNGAGQGGFESSDNGSAGVDYLAFVGNIAYNAVQGSSFCTSAFNTFAPVANDTLPGTHIYIAGNFAYDNVEPNKCDGTTPTDGQGFFFDTTNPYSQQMVIDNNIAVFNGGSGIKSYGNTTGSPNARIYYVTFRGPNAIKFANAMTGLMAEALASKGQYTIGEDTFHHVFSLDLSVHICMKCNQTAYPLVLEAAKEAARQMGEAASGQKGAPEQKKPAASERGTVSAPTARNQEFE
jgi:hypothetical protein